MAMTAVLTNISHTKDRFIVDGTVTLSGNYGTSGGALPHGDTLSLSGLCQSNTVPTKVMLWSTVPIGDAPLDDTYHFLPGTTQLNGVVQIALAGTEYTPGTAYSGASPTNVTGYVLHFQAEFVPFQ
jgi:hypothetical protein